jgi:hypothetical protein
VCAIDLRAGERLHFMASIPVTASQVEVGASLARARRLATEGASWCPHAPPW